MQWDTNDGLEQRPSLPGPEGEAERPALWRGPAAALPSGRVNRDANLNGSLAGKRFAAHAIMAMPAGDADAAGADLGALQERALERIRALHAEIEWLTLQKEQTRAGLRQLLLACLARLDAADAAPAGPPGNESPPPASAGEDGSAPRLLERLATSLARRRLECAECWNQAPLLLVLALIIIQQLMPTIQRMTALG